MAREARGIEVFGRGATVVEFGPRDRTPRTPALGAAAVLLAVMAAAALIAAIVERSRGSDFVDLLAWIALGASALAVLGGLAAVVTGRGRLPGFVAVVLGALANPWALTRMLEWAATLVE
jgi:uncharacterized membrane protein YfcA